MKEKFFYVDYIDDYTDLHCNQLPEMYDWSVLISDQAVERIKVFVIY